MGRRGKSTGLGVRAEGRRSQPRPESLRLVALSQSHEMQGPRSCQGAMRLAKPITFSSQNTPLPGTDFAWLICTEHLWHPRSPGARSPGLLLPLMRGPAEPASSRFSGSVPSRVPEHRGGDLHHPGARPAGRRGQRHAGCPRAVGGAARLQLVRGAHAQPGLPGVQLHRKHRRRDPRPGPHGAGSCAPRRQPGHSGRPAWALGHLHPSDSQQAASDGGGLRTLASLW